MAAPSVARTIDRKSSIETEPRTLDINQIQFAREAALYVMSTKTIEEAFQIFTEGLEPVVSPVGTTGRQDEEESVDIGTEKNDRDSDDEDEDEDEEEEEDEYWLCTASVNYLPFQAQKLRDAATAPF